MAVKVGLIVPVYKNFRGLAELMGSVDYPVQPFVIPNWEKNLGVSAGWNKGLREAERAGCTHSLVCNDDVVLEPHTITKLLAISEKYDLVSAINTRQDAPKPDHGSISDEPDFSCFMVKAFFLNKFGYFDTNFSPAYFEDNDMAYRIKLAGGRAVCRTDARMLHHGSVTQNWDGEQVVTGWMFERNRSYYISKWGGNPGQEAYTEPFNGEKQ